MFPQNYTWILFQRLQFIKKRRTYVVRWPRRLDLLYLSIETFPLGALEEWHSSKGTAPTV